MSLRTCPKCKHQILSFGRFLIEPNHRRSYTCAGCKSTLSLALRHHIIVSFVAAVSVLYLVIRSLPTYPEIPIRIAVVMVLSFFLLVKGMIYLLAVWQIKEDK